MTTTLNDQNHNSENCIEVLFYSSPIRLMERAGFITCTAASHQGAIKEPAASLFRMCEAHPVVALSLCFWECVVHYLPTVELIPKLKCDLELFWVLLTSIAFVVHTMKVNGY